MGFVSRDIVDLRKPSLGLCTMTVNSVWSCVLLLMDLVFILLFSTKDVTVYFSLIKQDESAAVNTEAREEPKSRKSRFKDWIKNKSDRSGEEL